MTPSRPTGWKEVAWLAPILVLWGLTACPRPDGSSNRTSGPPEPNEHDYLAGVALDCLSLLEEYNESDLSRLAEAELERQMEEALLNQELCARALREAYHGPGGSVMGEHLARAMSIHALQAELTLSSRFDEEAGYCDILTDLVRLLDADFTALSQALDEGSRLGMEDVRPLVPLRDLTLQSLQVSLVDYGETCQ